jgi:hypothetical protein
MPHVRICAGGAGQPAFLPRADAHFPNPSAKPVSVDSIPISNEEPGALAVARESRDDLPDSPFSARVRRDVEVDDPPAIVRENDEAHEPSEGRGGNGEEVAGRGLGEMVPEEGHPPLGTGPSGFPAHVLLHRGLGDIVS